MQILFIFYVNSFYSLYAITWIQFNFLTEAFLKKRNKYLKLSQRWYYQILTQI